MQVEVVDDGDTDYLDPLRRSDNNAAVSIEDLEGIEDSSASGLSSEASIQNPSKEWVSFKRSLMQRFPVSKTVLTSSVSSSCVLIVMDWFWIPEMQCCFLASKTMEYLAHGAYSSEI